MLSSKLDLDNSFDLVIKKSIPFLILAPKEFREKLVELLAQFHHYYTEREETAFKDKYESICNMLETAEFDQLTGCDIHYFGYQTIPVEQAIKDINHRLSKIEKWIDLFNENASQIANVNASQIANENSTKIENENSTKIENENAIKSQNNATQVASENAIQVASENAIQVASENAIQVASENAIQVASNKKSNTNLVLEILKSSDKPVYLETIIEVTGLKNHQIHVALARIRKKHKVITIPDGRKTAYLLEK